MHPSLELVNNVNELVFAGLLYEDRNSMDTLGSYSKKVQELVAELARIRNVSFAKLPVSTKPLRERPLEPNETLYNEFQRWKHYQWAAYGIIGLSHALMWHSAELVKKKSLAEKRWVILDDMKKKPKCETYVLLATVHPEILDGLLCGDFMYRYYHEPRFEALAHQHHNLHTTPGIYVNYICRTKHSRAGLVQADAGKSLSPIQLQIVLDRVELYLDHDNDPESQIYAKRCDSIWPPVSRATIDWAGGERRYFLSDDVHEEWSIEMKSLLSRARKMSSADQAVPLMRCFAEVGFGQNCASRAGDHAYNKATNKLFGLVHAIVELEWEGEFEVKVWQIFRITKEAHGKLSELIGSLICDSFWYQGGLNPMISGNVDLSKDHLVDLMLRNKVTLERGSFLEDNLAESEGRLKRAKELLEFIKVPESERRAALDREHDAFHGQLLAFEKDAANLDALHGLVELKKQELAWFEERAEQGLPPIPSFLP